MIEEQRLVVMKGTDSLVHIKQVPERPSSQFSTLNILCIYELRLVQVEDR
jgi:hypothetical protein